MKKKTPEKVVRFYGNTDYALECIALKRATFIHRDNLNDPFEVGVSFDTDFGNNYESLLRYVQRYHPSELTSFREKLPMQGWYNIVGQWAMMASRIQESLLVFSASAEKDGVQPQENLYMWGHYGNGHRGIAIEFNTAVLTDSLMSPEESGGSDPWYGMEYDDEMPKITRDDIFKCVMNSTPEKPCGPELIDSILKRACFKGMVWERENEWRISSRFRVVP